MSQPMSQTTDQPTFLLEENHDLPLCRLQVTVRTGAATDPVAPDGGAAWSGRCDFATELMRRGAGGKSRAEIDVAVDDLGASLQVLCGHDSVLFEVLALKEKLPAAARILADVVLRPDFPKDEADKLRRETLARLDDLRDDDGMLARRFFARALYGDHPYGRPVAGVRESVEHFTVEGARAWHDKYLRSGNLLFGAAGDLDEREMRDLFGRHFAEVPAGERLDQPVPEPRPRRGLGLLLVDKPERTQSQILFGQLGPRWGEPEWLPMQVAITAFGGTFTARLMDEVRVKRGLSYGASARLGAGRGRRAIVVHVFPSAAQTAETIDLVLRLYREWATPAGLRPEEIDFARGYLHKSYAFSVQTPESRLNLRTELELCGLSQDNLRTYPQRVQAVTAAQVRAAMERLLRPEDLLVTLVGTEKLLGPTLVSTPALAAAQTEIVPYDSF